MRIDGECVFFFLFLFAQRYSRGGVILYPISTYSVFFPSSRWREDDPSRLTPEPQPEYQKTVYTSAATPPRRKTCYLAQPSSPYTPTRAHTLLCTRTHARDRVHPIYITTPPSSLQYGYTYTHYYTRFGGLMITKSNGHDETYTLFLYKYIYIYIR